MVGSAVTYFAVSKGPSLGRCSLKPANNGTEIETVFKLYCIEWRDEVSGDDQCRANNLQISTSLL
jgi:hypothetical protein